jgi:hypothetical protein
MLFLPFSLTPAENRLRLRIPTMSPADSEMMSPGDTR